LKSILFIVRLQSKFRCNIATRIHPNTFNLELLAS
jgi:hypothetical protein